MHNKVMAVVMARLASLGAKDPEMAAKDEVVQTYIRRLNREIENQINTGGIIAAIAAKERESIRLGEKRRGPGYSDGARKQ